MNTQKLFTLRRVAWSLAGTLAAILLLALLLLTVGIGVPLAAYANGPTIRYVAPTGTDNGDCTNPNNPCRTIQYAIDQAGPNNEIRIAAGTYTDLRAHPVPAGYPNPPASGVITQVAYVTKTLTLRGGYTTANWTTPNPAANLTTLDAGGKGRGLMAAGDISVTVEGLRFTSGNAVGLGGEACVITGYPHSGGGVYVLTATLALRGCQVYSNTASYGGGLSLSRSDNSTLTGNTFSRDTALSGGGLILCSNRNIVLTDNIIDRNTVSGSAGGLLVVGNYTLTLTNNTISGNTADGGGGMDVTQNHNVALTGNHIVNNTARTYTGGGLRMGQSYMITLTGNTISGNTASSGGGLEMGQCYTVTLTGNRIISNTAQTFDGGGLDISATNLVLTNNLISGNRSEGNGGGLGLLSYRATVSGNTISGNTAAKNGGGLDLSSVRATLSGNTISGNTAADDGGGVFVDGNYATLSGNLISGNTAITGDGGGVCVVDDDVRLSGNTIISNLAGRQGGGVVLYVAESTTLTGNTIVSNTAPYGGGLSADLSWGTVLDNNVIANNSCSVKGAGLYVHSGSRLRLRHNSIVRNTGGDGSGVCLKAGTVVMTNTILAGHTTGITVTAGYTATLEATLWGSGAWFNGVDWAGNGKFFTGTVNLWGNPGFVNPTAGDYHIGLTSAALDAGMNAGVTTDIDGDPRPYGSGHDIGADEYTGGRWHIYLPLIILNR